MSQATGGTGATSAFNNQVVTLISETTSVIPQVEVTYVSSSEGSGGTQVTTRTTISVLIVFKLISLIQMYLMVDLMVGLQVILQHLKLSVLPTDQDHLLMQNLFLKYLMTVHSVARTCF